MVKERLKQYLSIKRLSIREFSSMCDLSPSVISRISESTKGATLRKIETKSDLNIDWLLSGVGTPIRQELQGNAKEMGSVYIASEGDDAVMMVDFVPVSARASFIENLYQPGTNDQDKFPIVARNGERESAGHLTVFEVEGDSMMPSISSGCLILAKEIPEQLWHTAEGVIVIIFSEFVAVKRVERNELQTESWIKLKSDNDKYSGMTVQMSDIRAIYKAKRKISEDII